MPAAVCAPAGRDAQSMMPKSVKRSSGDIMLDLFE
jgi:hypothetical protein